MNLLEEVKLCPGKRVLDIGCGTGDLAAFCAKTVVPGGTVIAVDPEEERICVAKEQFHELKNLQFFVGKSINFPIDGPGLSPYDVIITNAVMHWVPDEEKLPTFKRMFSSLRQGGLLAINTVPVLPSNMKMIFDKMVSDSEMKKDLPVLKFFYPIPKNAWENLAKEVGFNILKSEIIVTDTAWSDLDEYLEFLDAIFYGKLEYKRTFEKFKDEINLIKYDDGKLKHITENVQLILQKP